MEKDPPQRQIGNQGQLGKVLRLLYDGSGSFNGPKVLPWSNVLRYINSIVPLLKNWSDWTIS